MTDRTKNVWGMLLSLLTLGGGVYGVLSGTREESDVSISLIGMGIGFLLQVIRRVTAQRRVTSVSMAFFYTSAFVLIFRAYHEKPNFVRTYFELEAFLTILTLMVILELLNTKASAIITFICGVILLCFSIYLFHEKGFVEGILAIVPTLFFMKDALMKLLIK
jgi:hypothetical protein